MKSELDKRLITIESKNKQLETTAESMRLSILGKDSKSKDDKPLEVVATYVKENTARKLQTRFPCNRVTLQVFQYRKYWMRFGIVQ